VKPDPAEPEIDEAESDKSESVLEETFTFEVGVAWNRHHDFGADGMRHYTRVTLMLYEGGKVRIEDEGKLKRSTLDNTYGYESETTEWSNVWMGTWAMQGHVMVLELQLFGRGCEKVIAGLEGTPETMQECEKAPKDAVLECKSESITLDSVMISLAAEESGEVVDESEQVVEAWLCHRKGKHNNMAGTPLSWVFGKGVCLEASSGPSSMARIYGPCRDDDPI